MTRRLTLMLVVTVVAVASLLPGSVFAQSDDPPPTEPYSGGTVSASSLVPLPPCCDDKGTPKSTTADPATSTNGSQAVLDNTLGREGETLPNTGGFQSVWLAVGGLLLIAVGVSLVWIVRSRSDA